MTPQDIEKSLNYRLSEYLTEYPIDVDYPAVGYNPVVGTPYLKIDYLHGQTEQVQLGSESADREVGVYQITVNIEGGKGTAEATTIISQLKEYFKRGTVATYNDVNVRITSFYMGSYSDEGDWYRQVVNAAYRSDIAND